MTRPADVGDSPNDPSTARWRRIDELFAQALDAAPAERRDWLRERCSDDPDLFHAVLELLDSESQASDYFDGDGDGPVAEMLAAALGETGEESHDPRVGSRVGAFRIIARIGRGGMADVYLAEREEGEFRQRVAVKIQRRGLDTDDLLRRFRVEREILSTLEHPNIARLIDGGATDDDLPYLTMEYVEGLPITEYCERERLPLRGRLELFVEVARAVQAAHARLVVHRDIKPSNILVTSAGRVKLLDFGIAKLLDPTTLPGEAPRTRTGFRPLTPEYASPEQVLGAPITTASDVYQLGLVLYRILTGGRPYEGGDRRALEDAITETRPSRPSEYVARHGAPAGVDLQVPVLLRRLRGDLDAIVLTALRKEPERRYSSAIEMAEDVRRHLAGRPISAREDSRPYRIQKFLQRNPWVAPAAALVAAALGLYVVTLVRHGRQLEVERNVAQLEAERARTTQEFLVGLFRSADPFAPLSESRRDIRVSDVMEQGVRRARSELADRPEMQSFLLGTIGDVFLGLGDPARATELRREALELARSADGPDSPAAIAALRQLVEPTIQLDRRTSGWSDSAPRIALSALHAARALHGVTHPEALRAEVTFVRSLRYSRLGMAAAEPILSHAIGAMRMGEAAARAVSPGTRREEAVEPEELADALITLANIRADFAGVRYPEAAVSVGREGVDRLAAALGPHHVRVWAARVWLAGMLPDHDEAIDLGRRSAAALDTLLGAEHDLTLRAFSVHGRRLREAGRFGEAATVLGEAADRRGRRDGREGFWYVIERRAHGHAALLAGRGEEALAAFDEMTALEPVSEPFYRIFRAWGLVLVEQPQAALGELERAASGLADPSPSNRAAIECVRTRALRALGRTAEAEASTRRGFDDLEEAGYDPPVEHPCGTLSPSPEPPLDTS